MIERNFDIPFVANLALREKQIQQNYRPIISVHKWFARRPGTLFRGLLLSEFSDSPLRDSFYRSNYFPGINVADPFMGGGTPILEANRVGCNVLGLDINPMSYWIVKQEIEHLDLQAYYETGISLRESLKEDIGEFYLTQCALCGSDCADVKYFLWVKVKSCKNCEKDIDLFPGYLLSADSRHPKNVFVCSKCGELTETQSRNNPGECHQCLAQLASNGPARRNHCACPFCHTDNIFPAPNEGPFRHRLFAIEYYCRVCKPGHVGRFFKKPDAQDLNRVEKAERKWAKMASRFVPDDKILSGDESDRLHRWGYKYYREMFNSRQLIGLELSALFISGKTDIRVRNALATNLSDLLRYQNMLCRYDAKALKSLDIFSVHGFPVGLIQCESNFLGIFGPKAGTCVGSGGWANIIEKYRKAKMYCDKPFEIRFRGQKKEIVAMNGEWIGDKLGPSKVGEKRIVDITCRDAASIEIPVNTLDAVFTDPPYFGNVQYAELMDFCYVWLRRLIGSNTEGFDSKSTRNFHELTGNENMGRGLTHFTEGVSRVFQRMAHALKPGSPLAFTYHHNDIEAYYPIAVAILDAGLTCSASLPCPGEMSASIHINGTGSSIIDTIFVCRTTGVVSKNQLAESPAGVAKLINEDLEKLRDGKVKPTMGDIRCIAYGHLIRLAIWHLKSEWIKAEITPTRMAKIGDWLQKFGGWAEVEKKIQLFVTTPVTESPLYVRETSVEYGAQNADIPF